MPTFTGRRFLVFLPVGSTSRRYDYEPQKQPSLMYDVPRTGPAVSGPFPGGEIHPGQPLMKSNLPKELRISQGSSGTFVGNGRFGHWQ